LPHRLRDILHLILSGFVLAKAYQKEFEAGMTTATFMKIRLIRLYPFFILGIIVGIPVAFLSIFVGGGGLSVHWTPNMFASSISLSALMLPTPKSSDVNLLYPLNPVLWSICFEIISNLIFIASWRFLRKSSRLFFVVLLFAIILIAVGFIFNGLDGGYSWDTAIVGFARVGFSFFFGVLLTRLTFEKRRPSNSVSISLVAITLIVFIPNGGIYYQLACIFLAFPLLIIIASVVEPGHKLGRVLFLLGVASYPMYALHKPVYQLLLGALTKLSTTPIKYSILTPWK